MNPENRIGSACWFKLWDKSAMKYGRWTPGWLRMWGTDFTEFESGPGQFPVGVIEDSETFLVHSVKLDVICFASIPPGE